VCHLPVFDRKGAIEDKLNSYYSVPESAPASNRNWGHRKQCRHLEKEEERTFGHMWDTRIAREDMTEIVLGV
jgi:hypothetical protein